MKLTEKEKKYLEKFKKDFAFPDPKEINNNPLIVISAKQGMGKTHLACSMSEILPVYILDTEYRGHIVAKKFENVFYKRITNYLDVLGTISEIIVRHPDGKCAVVIDSATDLQQFAELRYKEIAKLEKIWPQYLWAHIWDMCDDIIKVLRQNNITTIFTTRVKEEYLNDKPTGKMVPRIYNRVPYNADIMLEITEGEKGKKITATKNGYTNNENKEFGEKVTLPIIIKQLIKGETD